MQNSYCDQRIFDRVNQALAIEKSLSRYVTKNKKLKEIG
jgi:hypothetical protein